jgi:predicted nucleic acid-binding protein
MKDKIFLDTNILIYAHDIDAGAKHDTARTLVEKIWEQGIGIISTQVIQEFYVNITRKIPNPINPVLARSIILNYFSWQVEVVETSTILSASEIEEKYVLSFWDSLILATASQSGAVKILTEDLNHGQTIEGVMIENPFL